jgi:hypothetical protein
MLIFKKSEVVESVVFHQNSVKLTEFMSASDNRGVHISWIMGNIATRMDRAKESGLAH